jgi:hypothetical protein
MNAFTQYSVEFGKIARTLVYKDEEGELLFTFDIGPRRDPLSAKWSLLLNRKPLTRNAENVANSTGPDMKRVEAALERTVAYATTAGYLVALV